MHFPSREDLCCQHLVHLVVLREKNARAADVLFRMFLVMDRSWRNFGSVFFVADRNEKSRSFARAAFNRNSAALELGQLFYDRQAEPGSAVFPGGFIAGLCEAFKNGGDPVLRNSYSRVADLELEQAGGRVFLEHPGADGDASFFGKLDRVA